MEGVIERPLADPDATAHVGRMADPDPINRLNAALEGRYRAERELGAGGMAKVYLADDLKNERKVVLKVLKPDLVAVVGADRFLAEIKTTADLRRPRRQGRLPEQLRVASRTR